MKKQALVNIKFEYNKTSYSARVYLHQPTAVILPDKTVLVTKTIVHTTGPRRNPDLLKRDPQIFDRLGDLYPLTALYRPGNWNRPIDIHFPIVSAEPE